MISICFFFFPLSIPMNKQSIVDCVSRLTRKCKQRISLMQNGNSHDRVLHSVCMHDEQKHVMLNEQMTLFNPIPMMYSDEFNVKKMFPTFCKNDILSSWIIPSFVFSIVREHAIFALSLDNGDALYALAAFYDYPNIHGVPSNEWEEKWWKNISPKNQELKNVNAINTLFLHFFVSHPDYSEGCAEELINVTFKALPEINQILLCVPEHISPGLNRTMCLTNECPFFFSLQKVLWKDSSNQLKSSQMIVNILY